MTRALIIGPETQTKIDAAITRARAKPPLSTDALRAGAVEGDVIKLSDRKPGFERGHASENVLIPVGYRAAISFEQQPPGLCRHLSVSVDAPGMAPSEPAILMIAEAFGMRLPGPGAVWIEEFAPGHFAVNLVTLD